jgi:hypothetical protein
VLVNVLTLPLHQCPNSLSTWAGPVTSPFPYPACFLSPIQSFPSLQVTQVLTSQGKLKSSQ